MWMETRVLLQLLGGLESEIAGGRPASRSGKSMKGLYVNLAERGLVRVSCADAKIWKIYSIILRCEESIRWGFDFLKGITVVEHGDQESIDQEPKRFDV